MVQRSDNGWWSAISEIQEPGDSPASGNGDRCRFVDIAFELGWISGVPHLGDDESTNVAWFPANELPEPFVESHRVWIEWALNTGALARF